ncbi:ATP-dependent DNA helicase DDX11 [Lamellibrachia satsuma]|nr:ATP-dependent DNA helicase DDX11 [Lamellibrachia satsuma]
MIDTFVIFDHSTVSGWMHAETVSGWVHAETVSGWMHAETVSGWVHAETVSGWMHAETVSCWVHAETVSGWVHAETVSGWMHAETVSGWVHAETVSGWVHAETVSGWMHAETVSGWMHAETVSGWVHAETVSGWMHAETVSGWMHAETVSGWMHAETVSCWAHAETVSGWMHAETVSGWVHAETVSCWMHAETVSGWMHAETVSGWMHAETVSCWVHAEVLTVRGKELETSKKDTELDWISAFAQKQEMDLKASKLKEERELRLKRESRLQQLRKSIRHRHAKRKKEPLEETFDELFKDASKELKEQMATELGGGGDTDVDFDVDSDIVLNEYVSEDEVTEENSSDDDSDTEDHITKIYYCSRTHSQLTQFVREIQKSPFGGDTKVISLGSRQNLCINDAVKRLKTLSLINDRCLQLQKNKTVTKKTGDSLAKKRKSVSGGCPFFKQDPIFDYRDRILVDVKDIEQLVTVGRQTKACPYYGTRKAIPAAQVVALPYNTLLHRETRESCGIKLSGNIVIIDEAHNLLDTISNIHSIEVTAAQMTCASSQLSQYLERYLRRLKAKNLLYIRQIIFILNNLNKYLTGQSGTKGPTPRKTKAETVIRAINDFLFDTKLDNLNLFKLKRYCRKSQISKKLHGFVEKYQPSLVNRVEVKTTPDPPTWALSKFLKEISERKENITSEAGEDTGANVESSEARQASQATFSSPLMHIEGFLEALTSANQDGRIVINRQEVNTKSSLKFLLLNPAVHFADVVSEARAVIVAGGTMQPLTEFKEQLFYAAGVQPQQILEFACGHVIPSEQLLPVAMARGPSGHELDFTYQSRDTPQMMQELGRVMYNLCNIVPGGIVCFFPSYEYERRVYSHWERNGFLEKMAARKKIFREPSHACQVDHMLTEYTTYIRRHLSNKSSVFTGAVLLCVVGGKMSEGINFSDELGRCIVMVGLPYPNIRSPELKEKMDYLNANMPKCEGKLPGQVHYENLCMKAVNQSIGRAIRHKGDYATILLLDYRYLRPSIREKLPSWISKSLAVMDRFGPAFAAIRKFFAERDQTQNLEEST